MESVFQLFIEPILTREYLSKAPDMLFVVAFISGVTLLLIAYTVQHQDRVYAYCA